MQKSSKKTTKFKKWFLRFVIITIIFNVCLLLVSNWITLGFNFGSSLKGNVFLIVKKRIPKKGDIAAFKHPKSRFFQKTPFLKIVKGVEGDLVTRQGRDFFINRQYVGTAKERSQQGDVLVPSLPTVIGKGYYFMWSSHKDSYDSRYSDIGLISKINVVGTAYRLL